LRAVDPTSTRSPTFTAPVTRTNPCGVGGGNPPVGLPGLPVTVAPSGCERRRRLFQVTIALLQRFHHSAVLPYWQSGIFVRCDSPIALSRVCFLTCCFGARAEIWLVPNPAGAPLRINRKPTTPALISFAATRPNPPTIRTPHPGPAAGNETHVTKAGGPKGVNALRSSPVLDSEAQLTLAVRGRLSPNRLDDQGGARAARHELSYNAGYT